MWYVLSSLLFTCATSFLIRATWSGKMPQRTKVSRRWLLTSYVQCTCLIVLFAHKARLCAALPPLHLRPIPPWCRCSARCPLVHACLSPPTLLIIRSYLLIARQIFDFGLSKAVVKDHKLVGEVGSLRYDMLPEMSKREQKGGGG